jgi:hypothetical protein
MSDERLWADLRETNVSTYETVYARHRTRLRVMARKDSHLLQQVITDYNIANCDLSYVVAVLVASGYDLHGKSTTVRATPHTLISTRRYYGELMFTFVDVLARSLQSSDTIRRDIVIMSDELEKLQMILPTLDRAKLMKHTPLLEYNEADKKRTPLTRVIIACSDETLDVLRETDLYMVDYDYGDDWRS